MPARPFIVSARELPENSHVYPQSEERMGPVRRLGRSAGLTRLGVNLQRLPPGMRTSWPHAEEDEEEFVYVVEGEVDAWIDGEIHHLAAGDFAAFPAGTGICHCFLNNGAREALLLVGGDAGRPTSRIVYPLNPSRRLDLKPEQWWHDAPQRPLGPHDGLPDALRAAGGGGATAATAASAATAATGELQPRIVTRAPMQVVGMQIRTVPMSPEIPQLWPRFVARIDEIANALEPRVSYGVMAPVAPGQAHMDYLAAISVSSGERPPEGMVLQTLPGGTYATLDCPLEEIGRGFGTLYGAWLAGAGYEPLPSACFERYGENFAPHDPRSPVGLFVAVRRRASPAG